MHTNFRFYSIGIQETDISFFDTNLPPFFATNPSKNIESKLQQFVEHVIVKLIHANCNVPINN